MRAQTIKHIQYPSCSGRSSVLETLPFVNYRRQHHSNEAYVVRLFGGKESIINVSL